MKVLGQLPKQSVSVSANSKLVPHQRVLVQFHNENETKWINRTIYLIELTGPLTQWGFLWKVVTYNYLLVVFTRYQQWYPTCGTLLGVVFKFQWRAAYLGSFRFKHILAHLGMPKCISPSMNGCRMFFVENFTTSEHVPKTCQKRKVSSAKQPIPNQKSRQAKGWLY